MLLASLVVVVMVTVPVPALAAVPTSKVPPAVVAVSEPKVNVVPEPLLGLTKISLAPALIATAPSVWWVEPLLAPLMYNSPPSNKFSA